MHSQGVLSPGDCPGRKGSAVARTAVKGDRWPQIAYPEIRPGSHGHSPG